MRIIPYMEIVQKISKEIVNINCIASADLLNAYNKAGEKESGRGKEVLTVLKENAEIAACLNKPICQDTGTAVVFLKVGDEVKVDGGFLLDAVNEGIEKGYQEGYLRKSIVKDPFNRENTGNNLPAVIHTQLVRGDQLEITLAAKGGGSENMSQLRMLPPSSGKEGVMDFVVKVAREAGPNPCPPIIVGVGIGSNFEGSALLAKEALLRPLDEYSEDEDTKEMELELEKRINSLGIGPQGLGGKVTAFRVNILRAPCHIASLPVAVNINCHVTRHSKIIF